MKYESGVKLIPKDFCIGLSKFRFFHTRKGFFLVYQDIEKWTGKV